MNKLHKFDLSHNHQNNYMTELQKFDLSLLHCVISDMQ